MMMMFIVNWNSCVFGITRFRRNTMNRPKPLALRIMNFLFLSFLPYLAILIGVLALINICNLFFRKPVPIPHKKPSQYQLTMDPLLAMYAKAACVIDYDTGRVLFSRNAGQPMPLASLTKIMTARVVLNQAGFTLSERFTVTTNMGLGRVQGTSRLGLIPGDHVSVRVLLLGMMVGSANDAAYVLAAHSAGSIPRFVSRMNALADSLGLKSTRFVDPNGYDGGDVSSALEYARLCRDYLRKFPDAPATLHCPGSVRFPENAVSGRAMVTLPNRNPLIGKMPGVDGLKTGYTLKAGCTLALTGTCGKRRMVAVLLGIHGSTEKESREWMAADGKALFEAWKAALNRESLMCDGDGLATDQHTFDETDRKIAESRGNIFTTLPQDRFWYVSE
jgi:D-alanyl-D-alanine carboxypeptidase